MLHKDYIDITNKLGEIGGVEIITNGDLVNEKSLIKIYESKATRLLISLYDGPDQIIKFKNMIRELKIPEEFVILRDRWYSDKIDYGVKLTNRVGTISAGNQPNIENYSKKKCYYTAYQMLIDWNGDVFLCPQDWQKDNIIQNYFDIWKVQYYLKMQSLENGWRHYEAWNKKIN